MLHLRGTVLNARGETVGGGLRIDPSGTLQAIDPVADAPAGAWVVPGFVDVHCHGGGGASFPDRPTPDTIATAIAAHRGAGTTALVASLVSLPDPIPEIEALVAACEDGELAGIHLEGPYISAANPGAHDPAAIREPDLRELGAWLAAGRGWIRSVTVAPETPGAWGRGSVAHALLDAGAVPSWGHTRATGQQTASAVRDTADYAAALGRAGLPQTATHLFNCMPPIRHRDPGPVRELLRAAADGVCAVELIGDGVHVAPELVGDVLALLDAAHGALLVSDAMAGAGMPDGAYTLGGVDVEITDSVARLPGRTTIAGSTARLSDELRTLVTAGCAGVDRVVRAAVLAPARALGLGPFGAHRAGPAGTGVTLDFRVGDRVNAVALGPDLTVRTVVREGRVVTASPLE